MAEAAAKLSLMAAGYTWLFFTTQSFSRLEFLAWLKWVVVTVSEMGNFESCL